MKLYDCRIPADRDRGIAAAVAAVKRGELVVLPTDTLYGLGCDAFKKHAVTSLLRAKGRGRDMPVVVMVGSRRTFDGLAHRMPKPARALADAFWPGALTIIVEHAKSLDWDIGDTGGTVAVRMPLHPVALDVLREIGPMAVSSANKTGQPPAVTAQAAKDQLRYAAKVYLDAGPCPESVPSTIVDLTGEAPQLVRAGAISAEALREVLPDLQLPDAVEQPPDPVEQPPDPVEQPPDPVDQLPSHTVATGAMLADQPPADQPPADQPPADQPAADQPAADPAAVAAPDDLPAEGRSPAGVAHQSAGSSS